MKKLILLAVVFFAIIGCERAKQTKVFDDEIHIKGDMCSTPFVVFEFDGCEYIAFEKKGQWRSIVHKGNCKYCQYRAANKEKP